jgi:hypothetical protein
MKYLGIINSGLRHTYFMTTLNWAQSQTGQISLTQENNFIRRYSKIIKLNTSLSKSKTSL